jgi:hypothetical protein
MTKKKGQRAGSTCLDPKEDIDNFTWPPFFEPDDVGFLVRRVREAASNEIERRVFTAILRRAYEDVMEMEILYRELPGVMRGDPVAIRSFRDILAQSEAEMGTSGEVWGWSDLEGLVPAPDTFGKRPCGPRYFVKPSRIFYVTQGIDRIAQGDSIVYEHYLRVLGELWERTVFVDRFYQLALEGIERDGRDRLGEYLRLLARDARAEAWPPGDDRLAAPPGEGTFDVPFAGEWGARMPDPGDTWPPPDEGVPLHWPPPKGGKPDPGPGGWPGGGPLDGPGGRPPGRIFDPCDFIRTVCRRLVMGGLSRLRPWKPSVSTYATGITSISPTSACQGENITIHGSGFGTAKPPDVNVLIGDKVATVVSWSDSAIVVTVPAGTKSGCVGFRNETTEAERTYQYSQLNDAMAEIGEGLACLGVHGPSRPPPYVPSTPPCTAFNFFAGTLPEINSFNVNGYHSLEVEPNTVLTLAWKVANATTIRIRRTSAAGPPLDVTNPPGDTVSLGPFPGMLPVDATYELTATNKCGKVTRTVSVQLRTNPVLQILGVEIIQTIQRFDLANPVQNNSVRLVANKRTLVRVYVDSGITNGFNNGAGPNEQANVTGSILIWPPGVTKAIDSGAPLNAGGVVTARPTAQINRDDLTHTLNFELPWQLLSGHVQILPEVWVTGHKTETETGWYDQGNLSTLDFKQRRNRILVSMRVQDNQIVGSPPAGSPPTNPPTIAQYNTSLQGARTRYPISENGFVIGFAPGLQVVQTNHDLTTHDGWTDLLDDIEDIADDHSGWQIWTAIVPDDNRYALNGIRRGGEPIFVARAGLQATFAHEMGHTFGIGHAPCPAPGDPGAPEGIDNSLPADTEDIGMDVPQRFLIPVNTSELMSYCTPTWAGATHQDRWPSIAFWDITFDALA